MRLLQKKIETFWWHKLWAAEATENDGEAQNYAGICSGRSQATITYLIVCVTTLVAVLLDLSLSPEFSVVTGEQIFCCPLGSDLMKVPHFG